MLTIFIVSDATGKTAERVVSSALVQFKDAEVNLARRGLILTPEQVRDVVQEAADCQPALIIHTLVSDDLRRLMLAEARSHGIDSMDLMGPLLDRLATRLKLSPRQKPGLFKQLAEAKSRQIEAVEFAFRHDDGQHAEELDRAEIVLVGVSRTMKTPLTLYLAYRGWFAANVPIIPEISLPPELLALPPARVICLVMTASRLQELRRVRANHLGVPIKEYVSLTHIQQELRHARRLCRDYGWLEVNVTGKPIEEIAGEALGLMQHAHNTDMA